MHLEIKNVTLFGRRIFILDNKKIDYLRKKIDLIDIEIIKLLDKRLEISLCISKEKNLNHTGIYDKKREDYIFDNLRKLDKNYLSNSFIEKVYKEILSNSVSEMKKQDRTKN